MESSGLVSTFIISQEVTFLSSPRSFNNMHKLSSSPGCDHRPYVIFTNRIIPCSPWTCHGIWLWRLRKRLLTCRFANLRRFLCLKSQFGRLNECDRVPDGFWRLWRRSRTPPLLLAHRASAIVSGWGIELCVAMAMMAAWLMFPSERGKFPLCQTRETWSNCPGHQNKRPENAEG